MLYSCSVLAYLTSNKRLLLTVIMVSITRAGAALARYPRTASPSRVLGPKK